MIKKYKPGDLARTPDGDIVMLAQRRRGDGSSQWWSASQWWSGSRGVWQGSEIDLTPVMVIELPAGARGGWDILVRAFVTAGEKTGLTLTFGSLVEQIKSQMEPTPEPQALDARFLTKTGAILIPVGDGTGDWISGTSGARHNWDQWNRLQGPLKEKK